LPPLLFIKKIVTILTNHGITSLKQSFKNILLLLVALNYIAFHAELFDEEYKANHRAVSDSLSFAPPSVTWETFDKSNAPQAFTLTVDVTIELIGYLRLPNIRITPPLLRFDIIRDKSPPNFLSFTA